MTIVMFKVPTFSPLSDLQGPDKSRPENHPKHPSIRITLREGGIKPLCSTSHFEWLYGV